MRRWPCRTRRDRAPRSRSRPRARGEPLRDVPVRLGGRQVLGRRDDGRDHPVAQRGLAEVGDAHPVRFRARAARSTRRSSATSPACGPRQCGARRTWRDRRGRPRKPRPARSAARRRRERASQPSSAGWMPASAGVTLSRHSRESGSPCPTAGWMPASAGMTLSRHSRESGSPGPMAGWMPASADMTLSRHSRESGSPGPGADRWRFLRTSWMASVGGPDLPTSGRSAEWTTAYHRPAGAQPYTRKGLSSGDARGASVRSSFAHPEVNPVWPDSRSSAGKTPALCSGALSSSGTGTVASRQAMVRSRQA